MAVFCDRRVLLAYLGPENDIGSISFALCAPETATGPQDPTLMENGLANDSNK